MRRVGQVTPGQLSSQTLFHDVKQGVLEELCKHCGVYSVKPGEPIRTEVRVHNRYVKSLYIIQFGYVTVHTRTKYYHEIPSFLAWRGKGQLLGEGRMLRPELKKEDGFPVDYYPPDVMPEIKATDACELLGVLIERFMHAADTDRVIYRNLTYILIDKNFRERLRTQVIQTPGTSEVPRVARTLKNLELLRGFRSPHPDYPGKKLVDGSIKTADIAGYIGAGVEAVGDALRALRMEGVIDYTKAGLSRGEIVIVDSAKLDEY